MFSSNSTKSGAVVAVLKPGDVLYIPPYWYAKHINHQRDCEDDNISGNIRSSGCLSMGIDVLSPSVEQA